MSFMKVADLDPACPNCIKETKVELIAGTPCTIKIAIKMAPPPSGTTYPATGVSVTLAEFSYDDGDGNSTSKELGPPLGPAYSTWDSGSTINVQFAAASWLTSSDFPNTSATLEITTDGEEDPVKMTWFGTV
jgi:hypothetical protein